MNFPKRVPVLAKPQEGSSMRNISSAAKTLSVVDESMRNLSQNSEGYKRFLAEVTVFFGWFIHFAIRNVPCGSGRAQKRHCARHRFRPGSDEYWVSPLTRALRFRLVEY